MAVFLTCTCSAALFIGYHALRPVDYFLGLADESNEYTFHCTCQELRLHENQMVKARRKGCPIGWYCPRRDIFMPTLVATEDQVKAIRCTPLAFQVFMCEYWGRRGMEYRKFRENLIKGYRLENMDIETIQTTSKINPA